MREWSHAGRHALPHKCTSPPPCPTLLCPASHYHTIPYPTIPRPTPSSCPEPPRPVLPHPTPSPPPAQAPKEHAHRYLHPRVQRCTGRRTPPAAHHCTRNGGSEAKATDTHSQWSPASRTTVDRGALESGMCLSTGQGAGSGRPTPPGQTNPPTENQKKFPLRKNEF